MRTSIDIDEKLMANAMRAGEFKTMTAAVEEGLWLLVRVRRQAGVTALRGKVRWEGSLEKMRRDR